MAKSLNKSFIFFKNLFRPNAVIPAADKKLTIFHKLLVAYISKPRKLKDLPDTISYWEWNHVKERTKHTKVVLLILSPVITSLTIGRYLWISQGKKLEEMEIKKFGEIQGPKLV